MLLTVYLFELLGKGKLDINICIFPHIYLLVYLERHNNTAYIYMQAHTHILYTYPHTLPST